MGAFAFGNVLLSGPCNLACPACIGRQLPGPRLSNLATFPLAGLGAFVERMRSEGVREVSVTGSNTDPLLYGHTPELTQFLRTSLPGVRLSLHTNGVIALRRLSDVHLYDRVTLSVASLRPATSLRMTGVSCPVDLEAVVRACARPLKISLLLSNENTVEVPEILARGRELGVTRFVLRCPYGAPTPPLPAPLRDRAPHRWFGGNPVFAVDGVEVTLWRFETTTLRCLNLFADGVISDQYEIRARGPQHLDSRAFGP